MTSDYDLPNLEPSSFFLYITLESAPAVEVLLDLTSLKLIDFMKEEDLPFFLLFNGFLNDAACCVK